MSLDQAARAVIERYPAVHAEAVIPQENRGGFSGARLWQVAGLAGPLCLRAWPASGPSRRRLTWIHSLQEKARAAGLDFVPGVFRDRNGHSWVEHDGRLWDVTAWMPGWADFHARPTDHRLQEACRALARLHKVWAEPEMPAAACPAVRQRLDCVRDWLALVGSGWHPDFSGQNDPVASWAQQAWRLVPDRVSRIVGRLSHWETRLLRLQPCLCDVWHAHVLFLGDEVSAIVDYGSVKPNHVAADLARLMGSFVGGDTKRWEVGLEAYRDLCSLSAEEQELARCLDQTGTVLGAANWLRWLYHERRTFTDCQAVAARLGEAVTRMERAE
jgi:hypothetical protein